MKKCAILFLFITLILFSCKKTRVCNCTVTTSGSTAQHTQLEGAPPLLPPSDTTVTLPVYTVNTLKKTYPKTRPNDMRDACFSKSEESIGRSYSTVVPGIYTITTTETGTKTYECKIE